MANRRYTRRGRKLRIKNKRRFILNISLALVVIIGVLFAFGLPPFTREISFRGATDLIRSISSGRTASPVTADSGPVEPMYTPLPDEAVEALAERTLGSVSGVRKTVIESGLSLRGRVNYFWGGKSSASGWDDAWGEPRTVDSEGSESTGQERPYGLDCSGFVAWCFIQSGMSSNQVRDEVGLGTWHQWEYSSEIDWSELQPGDLAFAKTNDESDNHVGICIGSDDTGAPLFVHCTAKFDNVVVTTAGDVFKYARRPNIY